MTRAAIFHHDETLRERIRARLGGIDRRVSEREGTTAAAVALVLEPDATGASHIVLTRRAARLRTHAGEWALPGGRCDPGEAPEQTARRELAEELSVSGGQILGTLDDQPTLSGFIITPVVLWMDHPSEPVPAEVEVQSVHGLQLSELDAARPRWLDSEGVDAPVLQLPVLESTIHAPTGAILWGFRELALAGRHIDLREIGQPGTFTRP